MVDYGMGNLFSLRNALRREGVETLLTKRVAEMREADAVVLPGVGGFRAAAERIRREELRDLAASGKPMVGICLGLQLLMDRSEEGPGRGLGLIPGTVKRLPPCVKVPHMGWNTLVRTKDTPLTEGVPESSWVYYVHSYYPDTKGKWVAASTFYGVEYAGLVHHSNVVGTQFHPEKSGEAGATILRNIVRMAR